MDSIFLNGGFIGRNADFFDTSSYFFGNDISTITEVANTGRVTLTGASLTLPAGLQPGDLVIVASASDDLTPNYPTGYTQGQRGRVNVGYQWAYKFMGNPVDTTVSGLTNDVRTPHLAIAFRGVDPTTPLDATPPTVTTGGSGRPNSPAITTVTDTAWVISLGFLDDDNVASTVTAPTNYTFLAASQGSSGGATVSAAYRVKTPAGAEDPGAFAAGGDDEWVAATLALRPVVTPIFGNKKNTGIWSLQNLSFLPVYNISTVTNSVNEGSSIIFNIDTKNVRPGTNLYYTIESVSGTVNSSDFNTPFDGSITIDDDGLSTLTVTLQNDLVIEESESFLVRLRTESVSGPIVATSNTITINDTTSTLPTYISSQTLVNQTADASRTLTNTNHQIGDMIVAFIGNRIATAPALLSGYTNITSRDVSNGTNSRSWRLQYKFATSASESITWTGAYGLMIVIRNASSIGQVNSRFTTATGFTINLPDLNNLDTTARGIILAGTYLMNVATAMTSPYTITNSSFGLISNNILSSQASKTITLNTTVVDTSWAVEIL